MQRQIQLQKPDCSQEVIGIDGIMCPDSDDFSVIGNSISDSYSTFELSISTCITGCPADLAEKTKGLLVSIAVANTYFDFEDYEDPVKTFIDDRFTYYIIPDFKKTINAYIQKNEAEVQDGFFTYTPDGEEIEFVGVDTVTQDISSLGIDEQIFAMKFAKDSRMKSYERSVFSFMEATGNMGGLFEIMEIAGGIFVGLFSGQMFFYSILPKLYHTEDPTVNEGKISSFKSLDNGISDLAFAENSNSQAFDGDFQSKEDQANENATQRKIDDLHPDEKRSYMITTAINKMRKRVKYDWKIWDYIFNLFRCFSFAFYCCCKDKRSLNLRNRLKLYDNGEEKFNKELDVVSFIRTYRDLSTLVTSMVDENEKFMITYQKSNSISFQRDTSESSNDENYEAVPKLFSRRRQKELHRDKVDNFMKIYSQERWSGRDYRLLHGVFSKSTLPRKQINALKNRRSSPNIYGDNDGRIGLNQINVEMIKDNQNPPLKSNRYEEKKHSDPSISEEEPSSERN
ncbi:unnamed protein product [Moneuplotes crassus]|uniref:Uncharacterized protein n=1 Tax=Euplotes crassus TaxID=5936 RepID=A0AAD2D137_EUPCR|nr:unnamed protein product [Moneuplotes crassus]